MGDRNTAVGTTRVQRDRDGQRPLPQAAEHARCVAAEGTYGVWLHPIARISTR